MGDVFLGDAEGRVHEEAEDYELVASWSPEDRRGRFGEKDL
jgi:hypothetical protein